MTMPRIRLCIRAVVFASILFNSTDAFASDFNRFVTSVECGKSTLSVTSTCRTVDALPVCSSQQIAITDGNSTFPVQPIGELFEDKFPGDTTAHSYLEFPLYSVKCIECRNQRYFILWYANGGNCETCERVELIRTDGKVAAAWPDFDAVYTNLCKEENTDFFGGFVTVKTKDTAK